MIILALDLSRNVGVAHDGPNGRPILSTKKLPKIEGDGENGFDFETPGLAYRQYLRELISVVKPDLVGFEAPLMPRGDNFYTPEVTVRWLFGVAHDTAVTAHEMGVTFLAERNVSSIKKFWAGHGYAKKPQMVAACRERGIHPADDNQADACGLWYLLKEEYEIAPVAASTPLFGRLA